MILFDQLRISDDGKKLYINLHVNHADYFRDIYLDSITILTSDKVLETNPHEPTSEFIYKKQFEDNQKEADLVITPSECTELFTKNCFSDDLFFVYVKVKGTPDACTPCRLDEEITIGVTFDVNMLYQRVMGYTNDLVKDCTVPVGFAHYILLWNGFKAAVETEHYVQAIKLWELLFKNGSHAMTTYRTKGCGCHG